MKTYIDSSKTIIFTDLDGTLLDRRTYSYRDAALALGLIESRKIPLIFCSSKTRSEQEEIREQLDLHYPFIVEDGGAILIEKGYFPFEYEYDRVDGKYNIIELGLPYEEIRKRLGRVVDETGLELKGYGDLSVQEIVNITGLDKDSARRARKREYEETIFTPVNDEDLTILKRSLEKVELSISAGGRFYGLHGKNNKGQAVSILKNLYGQTMDNLLTVGIGDSQNDISMLSTVDLPVIVQKPDLSWEDISVPRLQKATGVGPYGWNRFMLESIDVE